MIGGLGIIVSSREAKSLPAVALEHELSIVSSYLVLHRLLLEFDYFSL